jgi:cytochrome c peroxidase
VVFTLFAGWANSSSPERQAIARGEMIFNARQFAINSVPGLNGGPQDPVPSTIATGTCTLCHDTPNAGNHSVSMSLNIGIAAAARRTSDQPLYTLRHRITGDLVQTMDPGRALVTGKWSDIAKFKGPVLRALSARAPFFHDGSAASLAQVVEFYDTRFGIRLTEQEKTDLIAFLRAL